MHEKITGAVVLLTDESCGWHQGLLAGGELKLQRLQLCERFGIAFALIQVQVCAIRVRLTFDTLLLESCSHVFNVLSWCHDVTQAGIEAELARFDRDRLRRLSKAHAADAERPAILLNWDPGNVIVCHLIVLCVGLQIPATHHDRAVLALWSQEEAEYGITLRDERRQA